MCLLVGVDFIELDYCWVGLFDLLFEVSSVLVGGVLIFVDVDGSLRFWFDKV